jgi:CubicO group peptidase (beta-lactamase class C family)
MKLSSLATLAAAVALAALIPLSATATAAEASTHAKEDFDALVRESYPDTGPGAAVIVVRDGQTLYRGAHGLANLELTVPLQPDHIFRIGSITKQFTAAAILLLAERGQLQLSDPITKYLPNYPAQGHTVTLQHLLSHTSGIANYTELPAWHSTIRNDVSVEQLIGLFQDKPFDFPPGERWKYDNSGYVLLGAIIEKVSGRSYADFLRTNIFEPLHMASTSYEDSSRISPGRVPGYMRNGEQWRNADFLSMTHPYAAGALTSTVDDLARWNAAIEQGALLSSTSWRRAGTSFVLADGTPTRYGTGWIVGRVGPVATLEHGGGIHGFNAYVLRAPKEHLYVAVLANASPPPTSPQEVAVKLAARALEVSLDAPEIPIAADRLDEFTGSYQVAGSVVTISRHQGRLLAQEGTAERLELLPIGRDLFEERAQHSRYRFLREGRRVTALEIEPRILMARRGPRTPAQP